MANQRPFRILSLDGGGIRGLMTAIWLKRLEDELKSPLSDYFDLVAGTSTGGILACAISKGLSPERVIELYTERAGEVFPSKASRLWSRATRLFSEGPSAPKYDGEGLAKVLKNIFRTTIFGNLKIKPTLVFTYDVFSRRPVVFKNYRPEFHSIRVWEICKASSSAPTYFPAHMLKVKGAKVPLIDGGVVANNPTACAIAEAVRVDGKKNNGESPSLDKFIVASFGTGETNRPIEANEAIEWGAAEWARPIIDVLFDGSADSVNYIASHLLPRENYFRFQTELKEAYDDMDNSDITNINALRLIANNYIDSNEGRRKIGQLATRLKDSQ